MANADYIPPVPVSLGPTERYPFLVQHTPTRARVTGSGKFNTLSNE